MPKNQETLTLNSLLSSHPKQNKTDFTFGAV
jgi:hypothetical protein